MLHESRSRWPHNIGLLHLWSRGYPLCMPGGGFACCCSGAASGLGAAELGIVAELTLAMFRPCLSNPTTTPTLICANSTLS
jgi:hypothetical protein